MRGNTGHEIVKREIVSITRSRKKWLTGKMARSEQESSSISNAKSREMLMEHGPRDASGLARLAPRELSRLPPRQFLSRAPGHHHHSAPSPPTLKHRRHVQGVRIPPIELVWGAIEMALTLLQRHCAVLRPRRYLLPTRLPPGIPAQSLRAGRLPAIRIHRLRQGWQDPSGHWRRRRR